MEDLLVYDNPIVEGHSLYRLCGSTLNTVSNRDYRNRDYFDPEIKCLDMDTYEKNILQKSHADKTDAIRFHVESFLFFTPACSDGQEEKPICFPYT